MSAAITVTLLAGALAVGGTSPSGRISVKRASFQPATLIPLIVLISVPAVLATNRVTLLLSLCIAGATVLRAIVQARAGRARTERRALVAVFLGHVVAALRAGSPLPDACARAAHQLPSNGPAVVDELRRVAAHTRQGGNGAVLLTSSEHEELREVGTLWALSTRLGIPVADLLGSARERMDHSVRHAQATKAALAGPRATAVVLSVLPLAGILMGQAMGARPVALLTGGGLGGILLLAGTALVCAGFITSQVIIGRAAQ